MPAYQTKCTSSMNAFHRVHILLPHTETRAAERASEHHPRPLAIVPERRQARVHEPVRMLRVPQDVRQDLERKGGGQHERVPLLPRHEKFAFEHCDALVERVYVSCVGHDEVYEAGRRAGVSARDPAPSHSRPSTIASYPSRPALVLKSDTETPRRVDDTRSP
jgi:hypothetical protein